mgnify:CR=1 FL=1
MICHYKKGILVQTVTELKDEFDWDGMIKAQNRHQEHFHLFGGGVLCSAPLILNFCHSVPAAV